MNYYNDNDPSAVAWLLALIDDGLIPPGRVDNRSISDVRPSDLDGFTQCHFFAGIGGWPYALALAGWPEDRPVWTGSCPCQPYSPAGKGKGLADERHLWPDWFHLIDTCGPETVLGEQVAGAGSAAWIELVSADMEGRDYTFWTVTAPAAGFGAPHIRHRRYFVGLANNYSNGCEQGAGRESLQPQSNVEQSCRLSRLGNGDDTGWQGRAILPERADQLAVGATGLDGIPWFNQVEGFWRDPDWLSCRDGKLRPVEPGTFPLVDGFPARMELISGYGNAIVAPEAAKFIRGVM